MGDDTYGYAYDPIGSGLVTAETTETTEHLANAVNRHTNILCVPAPLRLTREADGNPTLHDASCNRNGVCVPGNRYACYAANALFQHTPSGCFTYAFDQAKNVTELFDSAGGIAAAYDHGPFGEDMAATGPAAGLNPFRFSSEVWDGALALVCYNWRHYNPLDGRFISRDPIEERGGLNLYGFVGNDPVNRWDALGLAFVEHLGADAVKLSPRIMPADYFTGPKLKNKDGNLPKLGEVWGYVTYSDKTLDCTCERKVGNRAAGTKTCYKMVCKVKWTAQIYLNEIIQGDAKKLMGTFGHEQRHVKAVWDNVESQIVGKLEEEDGVFDQKGPCDDACKKHKVVFLPILLDLADHTKERHGIDGHPNDGQLYDPLEGSVWKGPAHRK